METLKKYCNNCSKVNIVLKGVKMFSCCYCKKANLITENGTIGIDGMKKVVTPGIPVYKTKDPILHVFLVMAIKAANDFLNKYALNEKE